MANNKTIQTFTTVDIEKYHKGQLTPHEMHAMEKAALDDPFLADALEGYSVPDVNIPEDITELKKKLKDRAKETKLIPISIKRERSFYWFRAAAMIVIIAGAAFFAYRFISDDKETTIAQAPAKKQNVLQKDTNSNYLAPDTGDSNIAATAKSENNKQEIPASSNSANDNSRGISSQTITPALHDTATLLSASKPAIEHNDIKKIAAKQETGNPPLKEKEKLAFRDKSDSIAGYDKLFYSAQAEKKARAENQRLRDFGNAEKLKHSNIFYGRVTDINNNALPFANITNITDNVGTYSDARGYFVLTSPDSVLNVQVRSLGFENNTVRLQNTSDENRIILEEDNKVPELVLSNRQINSNHSRTATMTLEEPEPIDGWTNYDIYLANNLVVPESLKTKQMNNGEVELSFEIDKNGEPTNITVDKSLCESCDKEAVRLVKEGPKWKRKSKKRTTVRIAF